MENLISIIIPIYNVENYLDQCIMSILRQSYRNYEIILVDDGSTDKSGKICDKYASNFNTVKVFHKENGGLVSAWKMGVEKSSKESSQLMFVDPDDWITPNYLEEMYKAYLRTHAEIVVSSVTKFTSGKYNRVRFFIPNGLYTLKNDDDKFYAHFLSNGGFFTRGIPINRWGKLISKKLVLDNMHYVDKNVSFGEDLNLIFPLILDANSISINNKKNFTYFYRVRKDSMLREYDSNMWNSVQKVYSTLTMLSRNRNSDQILSQVSSDYIGAIILCYKNNLQYSGKIGTALSFIDALNKDVLFNEVIHKINIKEYGFLDRWVIKGITTSSNLVKISSYILLKQLKIIRNFCRERI